MANSGMKSYSHWGLMPLLMLLIAHCICPGDSLVPRVSRFIVKREIRRTANAALGGAITVGVLTNLFRQQQEKNRKDNSNVFRPVVDSMKGQTIFITGGTAGLGLETAKRLAIGGPSEIIVTARSHLKGQAAVLSVQDYLEENKVLNDCRISYRLLDLDSLQGIRDAVTTWINPTEPGMDPLPDIDVMINNAGILAPPEREITVDGVERQMQSNHLGHFLLTSLLVPKIKDTARIINISSAAHQLASFMGGLDFDYMWKGEPNYQGFKSYGQSKLANIYFSQQLYQRAQNIGKNWDVATVHPGGVQTDIYRLVLGQDQDGNAKTLEVPSFVEDSISQALSLLSVKPVPEGANTHVFLGSGAAPQPWKAAYYVDCMPQKLEGAAMDSSAAQRLWDESEELIGLESGGFFTGVTIGEVEAVVPEVLES